MADATLPAPPTVGIKIPEGRSWIALEIGRMREAARGRAAARKRATSRKKPIGLLHVDDAQFQKAALIVAVNAPQQFGRLDEIILRGRFVLRGEDVATLDELVHEAVRIAAIGFDGPGPHPSELTALDGRITYAADFLQRREGEIARRRYARGLLGGVTMTFFLLLLIGAGGAAVITLWRQGPMPVDQSEALRDVLVAVGAGAAGACVSVMLRMHRMHNLTIESAARGAAIYRIFLGWFFAAAVVFFLKSGLLAGIFTVPDDHIASWFFWGAVGFLAGFNERWATNLISRGPGSTADGTHGHPAQDAPDAAKPPAA
ncbi:hypothetical protein ACLBXX_15480 [Microbacterium sp. C23T]